MVHPSSTSLCSTHPTSTPTLHSFTRVQPRFVLPTLLPPQLFIASSDFNLASFYPPYFLPNSSWLHPSSTSLCSTHPTSTPTLHSFTRVQPRFVLPTLLPPQLFIASSDFNLASFYPPYFHPNSSWLHPSSTSLRSTHPTSSPTLHSFT